MYYVFNCSCVVARSVCLNSTCVKNLESPFYMNLEIKIYQIKHMCYYFLFHLRSILLFYQKVTSMLVISLTKIFHTFVCPDYAVSHVCFFFPPNCCEVVSPLFFLSLTTRSSIVATFVLGWSWRISTPWNRRHRKWNSG